MDAKRSGLRLTKNLDCFLDRKSIETGIDRSNLIRMLIVQWMERDRDREAVLQRNGKV